MKRKKRRSGLKIWITVILLAGVAFLAYHFGNEALLEAVYPRKYSEFVEAAARENQLEETFVYAVIRTESKFDPEAHSHAGAIGLMQLIPSSFEWVQSHYGLEEELNSQDLYDPQTNIAYGCKLLSILMHEFDDLTVVLCAYNAGIGTAENWLQNAEYSPDGSTITTIPYPETRNYVKKVLETMEIYQKLYY